MGRLEGKVAFVTGAARGQGRSHAVRLAEEGCDVIAVDICRDIDSACYGGASSADLEETVGLVERADRRIVAAEVDVRDLAGMRRVVDEGVAALGHLDIVVANAGIASFAPTLEMSEDAWNEMIDINLTGVWKTVRASVPHVLNGGRGGSVILTSSLAAFLAWENVAHYTAAKTGMIGLMRVLAKELAPQRIRVNTVHPCSVATDMFLNDATYRLFRPDLEHPTRADFEPVGLGMNALPVSMIEPIDVSNAVVYLASDDGRYVTGTCHMVTAGGHL
jgi:SDR family mycofactocin-dependent oxidoreductase